MKPRIWMKLVLVEMALVVVIVIQTVWRGTKKAAAALDRYVTKEVEDRAKQSVEDRW
jgi:hypothetical protein